MPHHTGCDTPWVSPTQRQVERVRFGTGDLSRVVAAMEHLAAAGDGWINLIPGLDENEEKSTSLGFFALFGGGSIGVTMCTWIPAKRSGKAVSLGITHVTFRRVVARLQSLGVPVPQGWLVEQDHPRRGLVLAVPAGEADEAVLGWALQAVGALTAPRPILGWQADVYLPLTS